MLGLFSLSVYGQRFKRSSWLKSLQLQGLSYSLLAQHNEIRAFLAVNDPLAGVRLPLAEFYLSLIRFDVIQMRSRSAFTHPTDRN